MSALGTALLCALVAVFLLGERAGDSASRLLDEQVRLGEQALLRQWVLRRAERQRAFSAIAAQPALREALSTANRSVLSAYVQQARTVGADAVALVSRQGVALWQDGMGGQLLPDLVTRSRVPESGALFALSGEIVDVFRLPVGTDAPVGYLIATSRVDPARLHADLDPFGVFAAVAVEGALVTSLPTGTLTTARWGADPQTGMPELSARYRLRVGAFDNGRVMLAAPVTKVRAFTPEFLRQIAGLLMLIVAGAVAVALVVLSRITAPIEHLQHAADTLGQGHLTRSRAMMKTMADRRDEIGVLARAFMTAAQRLHAVVNASQRLIRDIDATVLVVERSAGTVSQGALQQEERLKELLGNLGPLTSGLEQTSQGLHDARSIVVQLALHSSNADQAQAVLFTVARRVEAIINASASSGDGADARSYRTATVLQQVSALLSSVNDQREALLRIREQTQVLRTRLDGALESQVREQHHGQFAQRAGGEIGRVARLHAQEAEALRISAEQLRSDIEELQGLLHTLDARNEDSRPSINAVPGAPGSVSDRGRISLAGLAGRSTSNDSLAGARAAEARERGASGSGTRRPIRVGSSSPSTRPVTANTPVNSASPLSGTPPLTGMGAGMGGGLSSPGKLSTGRSSGTNKPVPSSAMSARDLSSSRDGRDGRDSRDLSSSRDGREPREFTPSAVSARGLRSTSPGGLGPPGTVSSGQVRPVSIPSAVSARGLRAPSAASSGDALPAMPPSAVSGRNTRSVPPSAISSGGLVPAVKPSALSGSGAALGLGLGGRSGTPSPSGLRAPSAPRVSGALPVSDPGQSGSNDPSVRRK